MSGTDDDHPSRRRNVAASTEAVVKSLEPDFSEPDTLVTFLIGPEETKFRVHKEFVCFHSEVLKAAFSSPFIEGQTQTYKLEDTSVGAFKFFVQWLYGQKLDVKQLKDKDYQYQYTLAKQDVEWDGKEDLMLAELWVLADKLAIPKLQNKTIEIIIKIEEQEMVALRSIQYIYENTATGNPFRQLVVHQCFFMSAASLSKYSEYLPHTTLLEVACHAANVRQGVVEAPTRPLRACDYFVPVNGKS